MSVLRTPVVESPLRSAPAPSHRRSMRLGIVGTIRTIVLQVIAAVRPSPLRVAAAVRPNPLRPSPLRVAAVVRPSPLRVVARIRPILITAAVLTLPILLATGSASLQFLFANPAAAAEIRLPDGVERVDAAGGITEYRLKENGMPILLLPDHAAPVITFMVVYHVGSRNESPGNTGSAHLLEHLLFNKSTESFGKANGHKTFQEVLYEAGADFGSTNMTTWYDRMNGYSTLPSDKLELAMKIEADRLGRALLLEEERETEMTVVRNEYEIGENDPSTALYKAVVGAAITAHPYHWDTIGYRSDIEGVSIEKLREHYRTYFWPDNATAILVGDFDTGKALTLFEREFGDFPRSSQPIPKVITEEPPQEGERRVTVRRPGEIGLVSVAYMRPGSMHPDFVPLDVLATILGDGVNSHLYQALVETRLATGVGAWNFTLRDPFPLLVEATLAPGSTHQQVEDALVEALGRVATEGVTAEELERAKKQIEVAETRSRDGTYAMATSLGAAVASADWKWFVGYLDQVSSVTVDDVHRVASTYLVADHATVGWFVPVDAEVAAARTGSAAAEEASAAAEEAARKSEPTAGASRSPAPSAGEDKPHSTPGVSDATESTSAESSGFEPLKTFAERTVRRVLANGVVLDVVVNRAVPTIAIQGSFFAGSITAPAGSPALPQLTAAMVQRGTTRRDKREIGAALDGVGARRSLGTNAYETSLTASCLAGDLPLLLDVLAEEILSPAFPDSELVKARSEMETEVLQAADNTSARAVNRLLQVVLPEGHPHRPVDPEDMIKSVGAITKEEIRAFHTARYVGSSFVLAVVGDVDPDRVAQLVEERFGAMVKGERPAVSAEPVAVMPSGDHAREVVRMPGKANWNLVLGHATTLTRLDPDYEAALLVNAALGQNALSSRIGRRVRDTEGLSYVINSRFLNLDVVDGVWLVNAFVAPENVERAYRSTREVIESYCKDGIEEEELETQKSFFAGNYKVRLGSNAGVAAALVEAERLGFTPAYLDDYASRIRSVSPEHANAALRAHLRPEALRVVIAGDPEDTPQ